MLKFIRNHKLISALVIVCVLAAGAGFYVLRQLRDNGIYVKVQRGTIVEAIYGIGTIKASRVFSLKLGIPSVVDKILVQEGAFVKKGNGLVVLDGSRQYRAPFDGIVTELNFKEGETVFPQSPILTVTDFKDRYVVVSLEQESALKAKPGQSTQLSFESMREQTFQGRVTSVYANGDRFLVRIDVPDLPSTILPGMAADVSLLVRTINDVLLVPINAIQVGKVYVKAGEYSEPSERAITTGILDGNRAQILSGEVREGDLVRVAKEN